MIVIQLEMGLESVCSQSHLCSQSLPWIYTVCYYYSVFFFFIYLLLRTALPLSRLNKRTALLMCANDKGIGRRSRSEAKFRTR